MYGGRKTTCRSCHVGPREQTQTLWLRGKRRLAGPLTSGSAVRLPAPLLPYSLSFLVCTLWKKSITGWHHQRLTTPTSMSWCNFLKTMSPPPQTSLSSLWPECHESYQPSIISTCQPPVTSVSSEKHVRFLVEVPRPRNKTQGRLLKLCTLAAPYR